MSKPGNFKIGDTVQIRSLKKSGIITRIEKGIFYITFGTATVKCKHDEIAPTQKRKKPDTGRVTFDTKRIAATSVDLHALTVDEALRKVEQWINDAVLASLERGEIIHGLGTGKVRDAVHKMLSKLSVVKSFRLNPQNPGSTDVYF